MEFIPGFVRVSRAWDAATALETRAERICISKYVGTQPAVQAELMVEWPALNERPELRVRQAGWELLAKDFSGLLRHMIRIDGGITPDDFCALLLRLGFADMTVTERPANVVSLRRNR